MSYVPHEVRVTATQPPATSPDSGVDLWIDPSTAAGYSANEVAVAKAPAPTDLATELWVRLDESAGGTDADARFVPKTGGEMTGELITSPKVSVKANNVNLGGMQRWAFNDFLEIVSTNEMWITPNSTLVLNPNNKGTVIHGRLDQRTGWLEPLSIVMDSGNIYMTRDAGVVTALWMETASKHRWAIIKDGAAESGSNVGSDLNISRYDDNGNLIDTVLNFTRSTGLGTVKANPTAALGIATKQYVDSTAYQAGWTTDAVATVGWNTITTPGLADQLLLGTEANGPGVATYFFPLVISYAGTTLLQIALPYISGNAAGSSVYMRGRYSGVWYAWGKLTLV